MEQSQNPATTFVFLDEASFLLTRVHDPLREALRDIEGIPNAKYLVRSGRVFVFEKLVRLVSEKGGQPKDANLADLARSLIDEATGSAEEAVSKWSIIPEPYEVEAVADGEFAIRHKPFNAFVSEVFSSREATQGALVKLLLGEIVHGERSTFIYRGQPMTLPKRIDGLSLAMLPTFGQTNESGQEPWVGLANVEWMPGFEPINEYRFLRAREAERAWKRACAEIEWGATRRVQEVWSEVTAFDLKRLNTEDIEPWYNDNEVIASLRLLYPELGDLAGDVLHMSFANYQTECWNARSWEPSRDEEFVFYLLGRLVDPNGNDYYSIALGKWMAWAWFHGHSVDGAMQFAATVRYCSKTAYEIANWTRDVMLFLAKDAEADDLRGDKIRTMGDLFRMGRSGPLIVAKQDFSQLQAKSSPPALC